MDPLRSQHKQGVLRDPLLVLVEAWRIWTSEGQPALSEADLRPQHLEELGHPGGVGGPGGGGDEVAVGDGAVDGNVGVLALGHFHLGAAGGVGGAGAALQDTGGGQELGAVADGGHGLLRGEEVADDLQHAGVQAQVLGGAAAGDHQGVVLLGLEVREGGVQGEAVAGLLRVGLVALEVVDGRGHAVAGLLVRAGRVDGMAHGQQGLEGDHDLVVLAEVADEHEDALACHVCLLGGTGSAPAPGPPC